MSAIQISVYATSISLSDLPFPFVSLDGNLNCTIVVASSSGHGPCGAAHTMDVMGAILVGEKFGLLANDGTPASTMDDYISSYDPETGALFIRDNSNNLVVVGGPGVNEITWYYNNLRNESGGRVLPVYFDKNASGVDHIYVASSGNLYYIEYHEGRVKADYAVIELYHDNSRFVLILGGLGGAATWAACKVVSSLEEWSLSGSAVVLKYYDSDEDGYLDTIAVIETCYSKTASFSAGALASDQSFDVSSRPSRLIGAGAFCCLSSVFIPSTKRRRKGFRLITYILIISILLAFLITSRSVYIVSSSGLGRDAPPLADFPQPFVASNGALNCSIVVASSSGHGPCGAAHTMDVMGAIQVGERLGLAADGGVPMSTMDDYTSSYDYATGTLTLTDTSSNLVAVGGPGVNEITRYYNDLRDGSGDRILPVYFDKNASGVDHIHVAPTGNSYCIEYDDLGRVKADYGIVEAYFDARYGRAVLIIGGLGGDGTLAASRALSTYTPGSLFGKAMVIRYYDSDGDGYLDSTTIVETAEAMGVYWDAGCTSVVSSVDWGLLEPGSTKNVTVFVRNEGKSVVTLSLNATDWNPSSAADYMTLSWDYVGQQLGPGEVIQVMLTLSISSSIKGITNFSFDIVITGSG